MDNTLSTPLASLVAYLIAEYPVNVGQIIATEMQDRALNERGGLPFPCQIGNYFLEVNIPLNKLVERRIKANRITATSKIKDVVNHVFGAKFVAVEQLILVLQNNLQEGHQHQLQPHRLEVLLSRYLLLFLKD